MKDNEYRKKKQKERKAKWRRWQKENNPAKHEQSKMKNRENMSKCYAKKRKNMTAEQLVAYSLAHRQKCKAAMRRHRQNKKLLLVNPEAIYNQQVINRKVLAMFPEAVSEELIIAKQPIAANYDSQEVTTAEAITNGAVTQRTVTLTATDSAVVLTNTGAAVVAAATGAGAIDNAICKEAPLAANSAVTNIAFRTIHTSTRVMTNTTTWATSITTPTSTATRKTDNDDGNAATSNGAANNASNKAGNNAAKDAAKDAENEEAKNEDSDSDNEAAKEQDNNATNNANIEANLIKEMAVNFSFEQASIGEAGVSYKRTLPTILVITNNVQKEKGLDTHIMEKVKGKVSKGMTGCTVVISDTVHAHDMYQLLTFGEFLGDNVINFYRTLLLIRQQQEMTTRQQQEGWRPSWICGTYFMAQLDSYQKPGELPSIFSVCQHASRRDNKYLTVPFIFQLNRRMLR